MSEDLDDDMDVDQIEYNPDEEAYQEDENGVNFEDMFIEAEHAPDPIKEYKQLIEIEGSNSTERKWGFKCYEKLAAIYLKDKNESEYEETIKQLTTNYSKVEDCDRQDTIRELITSIKILPDVDEKIKYFKILYECLKKENIQKEYVTVGVELCKILSFNKRFEELKENVFYLRDVVSKMEQNDSLKNLQLQLIILEIQICKNEGKTIDIKSLYLEADKLMKDQTFEDQFLTAIVNEEGGKICMRQKDFNQALEKFKFAFHSYRDTGNIEESVTVLKYAFIVSLLVLDSSIIMTKDEAIPYKNNVSLMNLVNLYDAYSKLDIKKINEIWNNDIVPKEKDSFIIENKDDILYNIRINYIVQKLKSYKNCKFEVLEKEIGIKSNELIGMIMNIAKNEMAKVKINMVKKQIEILEDNDDSQAALINNYKKWIGVL